MRRALGVAILSGCLLASAASPADASGDGGTIPSAQDATDLVTRATHGSSADRKAAETSLLAMGEFGVPALIVGAKKAPSEAMRKWCEDVLDEMGKRTAADEVQTESDEALIRVFGAFAEIKDVDALSAIFPFVGADRLAIREAARAALVAYGDAAAPRLRAEYTNLGGVLPSENPLTTATLLAAYLALRDQLRLQDVTALFDRGLAEAKASDLTNAVADLDVALAREPMLERRAEAAPIYVQFAHGLAKTDPKAERAYDLKVLRLASEGSPEHAHAASMLAMLDADDLRAKGIVDRAAYEKTLALDPTNEEAKAALATLDAERDAREAKLRKTEAAVAASVAVTAILGALFFAIRNRRQK